MMNENAEENRGGEGLSTLLGGLLSNPEAMNKITSILSNVNLSNTSTNSPPNNELSTNNDNSDDDTEDKKGNDEESFTTFQNIDTEKILSKIPQILSQISSNKCEESLATKQQIALLLAVRPYLSSNRRELIDTFVKMSRLGAIFKNLM